MPVPECAKLDTYRIARDWTFAQLAHAMGKAVGARMSPRTLHYLLKRAPVDARPLDRTLHKIRLYLAYLDAQARRAKAKRRRAAKRAAPARAAAATPTTSASV